MYLGIQNHNATIMNATISSSGFELSGFELSRLGELTNQLVSGFDGSYPQI
jgi:hypothetical protein